MGATAAVRETVKHIRPVVLPAVREAYASAQQGLLAAVEAGHPGERYATAHLAALRASAAVLAARTRPVAGKGRGSRPTSVWVLLPQVAPELGEWALFFAMTARKRSAAETGQAVVTTREADDLVRDVTTYLAVVSTMLGLDQQVALVDPS